MNPITIENYANKWIKHIDWTLHPERQSAAKDLLDRVNRLLEYVESHFSLPLSYNPSTNSYVSGSLWGGFRTQDCPQGAPMSAHKQGQAVDVYDPHGGLDKLITAHPDLLVTFDLYREAPEATPTWTHLQTRKPMSGNRTFKP